MRLRMASIPATAASRSSTTCSRNRPCCIGGQLPPPKRIKTNTLVGFAYPADSERRPRCDFAPPAFSSGSLSEVSGLGLSLSGNCLTHLLGWGFVLQFGKVNWVGDLAKISDRAEKNACTYTFKSAFESPRSSLVPHPVHARVVPVTHSVFVSCQRPQPKH
jgi:hypothetical protein